MNIEVKIIPHSEQRYPTVGDWWFDYGPLHTTLQIRVSAMSDFRYELLVAKHEMEEAILCFERGITEQEVTEFDIMFERERDENKHATDAEPGDDIRAPYYREHKFATQQEQLYAKELGVDWHAYESAIYAL